MDIEQLAQAEAADADEVSAWIVVAYDPMTDGRTYSGPYSDAISAMQDAEAFGAQLNQGNPDVLWTTSVAPLWAPQ